MNRWKACPHRLVQKLRLPAKQNTCQWLSAAWCYEVAMLMSSYQSMTGRLHRPSSLQQTWAELYVSSHACALVLSAAAVWGCITPPSPCASPSYKANITVSPFSCAPPPPFPPPHPWSPHTHGSHALLLLYLLACSSNADNRLHAPSA